MPGVIIRLSEAQKEKIRSDLRDYSKWAGYILLAYSVPLLVLGICRVISAEGLSELIWYAPGTSAVAARWDFTLEDMTDFVGTMGIGWTISGVTGVVAAVFCLSRRFYWIAIIAITASAIFAATGVFALFLAMAAYWYLLSAKFAFSEYTEQLEEEIESMCETEL